MERMSGSGGAAATQSLGYTKTNMSMLMHLNPSTLLQVVKVRRPIETLLH